MRCSSPAASAPWLAPSPARWRPYAAGAGPWRASSIPSRGAAAAGSPPAPAATAPSRAPCASCAPTTPMKSAAPKASGATAAGATSIRANRSPRSNYVPGTDLRIEVLLGEFPVEALFDQRLDVFLALVAVIDVVGVLPDVDGEQALDAARQGGVGIAGRDDVELALLADEPGPARSELAVRGGGELVAEGVVAAKVLLERLTHCLGRLRVLCGQRLPVEIVVPRLPGVVEELAGGIAHHVLERARVRNRLLLQELIHGVVVLLVVLAVMEGDRLGGDDRRERILRKGKRRLAEMQRLHGFCSGGGHGKSPWGSLL